MQSLQSSLNVLAIFELIKESYYVLFVYQKLLLLNNQKFIPTLQLCNCKVGLYSRTLPLPNSKVQATFTIENRHYFTLHLQSLQSYCNPNTISIVPIIPIVFIISIASTVSIYFYSLYLSLFSYTNFISLPEQRSDPENPE